MNMYNFTNYSENYSQTYRILRLYCKDQTSSDDFAMIIDFLSMIIPVFHFNIKNVTHWTGNDSKKTKKTKNKILKYGHY